LIGLQLAPVVLSLILLGAHFMRAGNLLMVVLVLVLLPLLGVRRRWVARLVQAALVLGAAEWIRTLIRLVAWRSEAGQPVSRLVAILGSVALLTALSALVFRSGRLRRWYDSGPTQVTPGVQPG
jgi:hypothetical protein